MPSPDFGLQELVDRLRQRIEDDSDLLSEVMKYWTQSRPDQGLSSLENLIPVDDIEEVSDGKITKSQLRWALRDRENNGLDAAVSQIGRRLYIDYPSFLRWIEGQRKK